MSAKNGKPKAVFRVHAFDATWAPKPGFPRDYKDAEQVLLLLTVWAKNRHVELVLGKVPKLFPELHGVALLEMEIFYE